MAEGEEEADAERLAARLQHQADGVVDGGDVIGIECVAQAEPVRRGTHADDGRVLPGEGDAGAPADEVQGGDHQVEDADLAALGDVESRQAGHRHGR